MGTHLNELAFRHVAAAHVLKNEDVSRFVELRRGAQDAAILIHAIGGDAVGRAIDQERKSLRAVFGHVDRSEEVNAVAHGNAVFILGVVLLDAEFGGRRVGTVLGCGRERDEVRQKQVREKKKKDERKQNRIRTLHARSWLRAGIRIGQATCALGGSQVGASWRSWRDPDFLTTEDTGGSLRGARTALARYNNVFG